MVLSERQLFEAELNLARAKGNEFLAVSALHRALGGGWQADQNASVALREAGAATQVAAGK